MVPRQYLNPPYRYRYRISVSGQYGQYLNPSSTGTVWDKGIWAVNHPSIVTGIGIGIHT